MACTATVLVGLSPVAPFNGTIVTSDSSCDRVSAVVAALGAFVLLRSGLVPAQAPATAAPATITAKMPVTCSALPVGLPPSNQLRPRRADLPLTIASLPVVLSLWKSPGRVEMGRVEMGRLETGRPETDRLANSQFLLIRQPTTGGRLGAQPSAAHAQYAVLAKGPGTQIRRPCVLPWGA